MTRALTAIEAKRPSDSKTWPTCISYESGYVAGRGTSFDDAATAAGCQNLAAREGLKGHQAVDTEQLLAWQPDFLVVSCIGGEEQGCAKRREQLADLAGIKQLSAVKSGKVVTIPPAVLSSVGMGMLDLTEELGEAPAQTR